MIRIATVVLGVAFATATAAQQAAPSKAASAQAPAAAPAPSLRDLTHPRAREVPVRCRPGQLQRTAGRTLGEIFGSAWPASPDVPAARRTSAHVVTLGRVTLPAGVGGKEASAVSAVLVDAAGRPLRVEVLCVSAEGLDAAVKQAAMAGTYRAATFDGVPATSVAMVSWRLGAQRPER